MPSREKKEKVKIIKNWFEKADSLLVLHYKGLKVFEANELRGILSGYDADLRVLKNTLTRIALSDTSYEGVIDLVEGPIAVVFINDDTPAIARAIKGFSRSREDLYFQGGLLEDRILTAGEVETLATLPPREEMLGRIVSQLASPLSGLVGVCTGLIRDFMGVLSAVAVRKEDEAAAG